MCWKINRRFQVRRKQNQKFPRHFQQIQQLACIRWYTHSNRFSRYPSQPSLCGPITIIAIIIAQYIIQYNINFHHFSCFCTLFVIIYLYTHIRYNMFFRRCSATIVVWKRVCKIISIWFLHFLLERYFPLCGYRCWAFFDLRAAIVQADKMHLSEKSRRKERIHNW